VQTLRIEETPSITGIDGIPSNLPNNVEVTINSLNNPVQSVERIPEFEELSFHTLKSDSYK